MSSRQRRPKPRMPGPHGHNPLRKRKEENVLLHDEADLVNFRSDALNRFVSNQEYLENVTSKPIHTSRIVPPFPFPKYGKPKYDEKASDDAVADIVRALKPEELFTGDLRLMQAKLRLTEQEVAAVNEQRAQIDRNSTFSAESQFQSDAVDRLARAQAEGLGADSVAQLDALLRDTLKEYTAKFNKTYSAEFSPYTKRSVPISELAPDVQVDEAPPHYNPRSIMSFLDMKEQKESPEHRDDMAMDAAPFMGGDYEDFGIMVGGKMDTRDTDLQFRPQGEEFPPSQFKDEFQEKDDKQDKVNMDELNQFLAEPTENIDEMDALMNFDDNDNDDFNFLSQMDNMP